MPSEKEEIVKRLFSISMILILAATLVACGATPTPVPPTARPTEAGPPPTATPPPLAKELHVYNWSEYIDPEIYTDFENEFGVKVIEDTFASNEDLLAKLQAGATGYDLIVPSDYMVAILRELELLAELDYDNIPNFKNISDHLRGSTLRSGQQVLRALPVGHHRHRLRRRSVRRGAR